MHVLKKYLLFVYSGILFFCTTSYASHVPYTMHCTWEQGSAPASLALHYAASPAPHQEIAAHNVQTLKDVLADVVSKTGAAQLKAIVLQHREKIEALPCVLVAEITSLLHKELLALRDKLYAAQKNRAALLDRMGLPRTTTALTFDQEKAISPKLYALYLANEVSFQETAFLIAIREQCLRVQETLTDPLVAGIRNLEQQKMPSLSSQSCAAIEKECVRLKGYMAQSNLSLEQAQRNLASDQKRLAKTQEDIAERDHWWKDRQELATLREVETELVATIQRTQKTIAQLTTCQKELARLEQLITQEKLLLVRHVKEGMNLQKVHDFLDKKGLIDQENRKIFEAIKAEHASNKQFRSEIVFELTEEGKQLITFCHIKSDLFQKFTGNVAQKYLTKKVNCIFERAARTLAEHRNDAKISSYAQATAHACSQAFHAIRFGSAHQAFASTHFAMVLDYATNIVVGVARGIVRGAVETYTGMVDLVLHPYQIAEQFKYIGTVVVQLAQRDPHLFAAIEKAWTDFSKLPLELQTEHAVATLTTFMMPGPGKLSTVVGLDKTIKSVSKVIRLEMQALKALCDAEKIGHTLINGAAVPQHLAKTITYLKEAGKLTTKEQTLLAIERLEAPLTSAWSQAALKLPEEIAAAKKATSAGAGAAAHAAQAERKVEHAAQTFQKVLPEAGCIINERYYTKHALERIAPKTPQVMAELEARALARGYSRGSVDFIKYVQPRNIPISVIEDALTNGKCLAGKEPGTLHYVTQDITVITNDKGHIMSVFPS